MTVKNDMNIVIRSSDTGHQIELRMFDDDGEPLDLANKIVKFRLESMSGAVAVNDVTAQIIQDDHDPDLIGMVRFIWGDANVAIGNGCYVYRFIAENTDGTNRISYPKENIVPGVPGGLAQVIS